MHVYLFDMLSAISSGKVRDFFCLESGNRVLTSFHFWDSKILVVFDAFIGESFQVRVYVSRLMIIS